MTCIFPSFLMNRNSSVKHRIFPFIQLIYSISYISMEKQYKNSAYLILFWNYWNLFSILLLEDTFRDLKALSAYLGGSWNIKLKASHPVNSQAFPDSHSHASVKPSHHGLGKPVCILLAASSLVQMPRLIKCLPSIFFSPD